MNLKKYFTTKHTKSTKNFLVVWYRAITTNEISVFEMIVFFFVTSVIFVVNLRN